jgi:hypothetical protein
LASRIKCRNCGMRCESHVPSPCPVADDRAANRQQAIQAAEEAASEGRKRRSSTPSARAGPRRERSNPSCHRWRRKRQ